MSGRTVSETSYGEKCANLSCGSRRNQPTAVWTSFFVLTYSLPCALVSLIPGFEPCSSPFIREACLRDLLRRVKKLVFRQCCLLAEAVLSTLTALADFLSDNPECNGLNGAP